MTETTLTQRLATVEPNWEDVLRRSDRLRRRSLLRKTTLGAALAAALLVASAPALGIGGWLRGIVQGTPISTDRLTPWDVHGFAALADHNHQIALDELKTPAERQQALDRFGLTGVRLIGSQSGLDFYVIDLRGGGHCYATGRGDAGHLFSSVTCPGGTDFPSPTLPIMDESVTGTNAPSEPMHVLQLAGLAATGIAAVGVANEDGSVYATTPVRDNVFVNDNVPAQAVGPLVAYDVHGSVIWCSGPNPACRSSQTGAASGSLFVKLYLSGDASSADISKAIAAAKTEPGVSAVKFISKQAALAIMKKRYPNLTYNLPLNNPLPNAIELRVAANGDAATIASDLRAKKLPGVQAIRYGRATK